MRFAFMHSLLSRCAPPAYAGCFSLQPSAAVIAAFTTSRLNK
nr:MAG TPA: hypothetical protein [Caudoviricetes sp.]